MTHSYMKHGRNLATWLLVVAVAVGLIAFVARNTRPGAFFSGDGGLKFALVQQHAGAALGNDILPPPESWAKGLWRAGLAPFGPPFAYPVEDRLRVAFPPLFSLLATPGFMILGDFGLYILPVLGVIGSLLATMLVADRLGAGPLGTFGAVALVTASPLTLYGATFWEHAPAAAIAIATVRALLGTGMRSAALAGFLAAAGAALRPECSIFALVLFGTFAAIAPSRNRRRETAAVAVFAAGLALMLLYNVLAGGGLMGFHGQQWNLDAAQGWAQAKPLIFLFVLCFPAGPLALLALRPASVEIDREVRALCFASALTLLSIPFFVPNLGGKQLGPRYLVFLIPGFAVCAGCGVGRTLREGRTIVAGVLVAAGTLAAAWGAEINLDDFRHDLERDYATRIAPTLDFVRSRPERVVVFTHQWSALEFASLLGERILLRLDRFDGQARRDEGPDTDPGAQLAHLVSTVRANGIDEFLLVSFKGQAVEAVREVADAKVRFTPLLAEGQCAVYRAEVSSR